MSQPLTWYHEFPHEIPARLLKADRIVAYDRTRDADVLDWKQREIMRDLLLEPGVDKFPRHVFHTLKRTIDRLETIYSFAAKEAA